MRVELLTNCSRACWAAAVLVSHRGALKSLRPLAIQAWVDLVPYTEFDYSQSLIASCLTTLPDFRITPGLAYLGDYCEVSVGRQVALNGAAQRAMG
jgi:hypothetical protein